MTPTAGAEAEGAREELRALALEKGHAVDVARRLVDRLEAAFAAGALRRTPALEAMLGDLEAALDRGDEAGRLGGKSGEAARLIVRAIVRALDDA